MDDHKKKAGRVMAAYVSRSDWGEGLADSLLIQPRLAGADRSQAGGGVGYPAAGKYLPKENT